MTHGCVVSVPDLHVSQGSGIVQRSRSTIFKLCLCESVSETSVTPEEKHHRGPVVTTAYTPSFSPRSEEHYLPLTIKYFSGVTRCVCKDKINICSISQSARDTMSECTLIIYTSISQTTAQQVAIKH